MYFLCSLILAPMLLRVMPRCHDTFAPPCAAPGRPGPQQSPGARWSPKARVGYPSVAQRSDMAVSQLPKRFQRFGPIRKQVESARLIPADHDPAAADQMVHPVRFDPHCRGNLRDRQGARNASGAWSLVAMETPVPQANSSYSTFKYTGSLRRAKPFRG